MRGPMMQRPEMLYQQHAWVGGLILLLIVLALIVGAIVIVRMLVNRPHHGITTAPAAPAPPGATSPLEILELRFARGEIDEQEFRARRDVLRG